MRASARISVGDLPRKAERTVRALNRSFPDVQDYRNWPRCQQYLLHAQIAVLLLEQWQLTFPEAGTLLNNVGYYLPKFCPN